MGSYRKLPVEIEAMQLDGRTADVAKWITANGGNFHALTDPHISANDVLFIHTLEGEMRADPGDWIIRGVKGEFYPCKPEIFTATYEAVDR